MDAVVEEISDRPTKEAMQNLLASVDRVYHSKTWQESYLRATSLARIGRQYWIRVNISKAPRIETPLSEWMLCEATFNTPSHPEPTKAQLWLQKGHLRRITFSESIRPLRSKRATLLKVDFNDPASKDSQQLVSVDELVNALGEWAMPMEIQPKRAPLPDDLRKSRLSEFDRKLPEDFLRLTQIADGFTIAGQEVYGLTDVQEIEATRGTYLVLAEFDDARFLVLTEGGALQFMDHEELVLASFGSSFVDALRECVTTLRSAE